MDCDEHMLHCHNLGKGYTAIWRVDLVPHQGQRDPHPFWDFPVVPKLESGYEAENRVGDVRSSQVMKNHLAVVRSLNSL